MALSLQKIAARLGCFIEPDAETVSIAHVQIDSRRYNLPESTLFFALPGPHHDGHDYIQGLYARGYRYFVVEREIHLPDAQVLVVPSTLRALQAVAQLHAESCAAICVGITGSNGKTIVKEWLAYLLGHRHQVAKSPRSYNSQVGVPLSLWLMQPKDEFAILEAGISQPGEMEFLAPLIKPQIGIFTTIGSAHAENFHSKAEKIQEKLRLFEDSQVLIYPADAPELHEQILLWNKGRNKVLKPWKWSEASANQATISEPDEFLAEPIYVQLEWAESDSGMLILHRGKEQFRFAVPFTDLISAENAISSILGAMECGLDPAEIEKWTPGFFPVDMRLQTLRGISQSTLISDVYNNDERAFELALDYFVRTAGDAPKTVILSDFVQGKNSGDQTYERLAQKLSQLGIDRFMGVGSDMLRFKAAQDMEVHRFASTDELVKSVQRFNWQDYFVLVKGARDFQLERVVAELQEQEHDTVYEIHLNAIAHNLNYFRSRMKPGVKTLAMVKAFAYGVGMEHLALHLQYLNVDALGVAFSDEGVALRRAGVHLPILVMNPESTGHDTLVDYRLEPQLYSMRSLRVFFDAVQRMGEQHYPVHLKVETGMHRLGFMPEELDEALTFLQGQNVLRVVSVFSHLAASENPAHNDFTQLQIDRFKLASDRVRAALGNQVIRHLVNSAGITRFPEAQFEMVRLGLSLYGLSGEGFVERDLHPIGVFKTRISQVKEVPAGETVGYGRRGQIVEPTRIGVLPVGYADGISRQFGEGRVQFVSKGHLLPTVGSICMDMTMVQLVDEVQEGDEVILFDSTETIRQWAEKCGTIPYEILTRISQRVKRVYIQE